MKVFFLVCTLVISQAALAQSFTPNALDELDPSAENIEEILNKYDAEYEEQTGESSHIKSTQEQEDDDKKRWSCFRNSCPIWAQISLSQQRMYLWLGGVHYYTWAISSGVAGHATPTFDTHPNGRIYDAYTSTKYPEGDYMGLGNMPYAVFISGGYAIHGTTAGNLKKLGRPASHGCIRLHPEAARVFNMYVRANGIKNVWITVHQ